MSAMHLKQTPPISESPVADIELRQITQWICQTFQWSIGTTERLEVPSAYEQWIAHATVWTVDNVDFPIWAIESFSKDLDREAAILEHWAQQSPYALVIWNSRGKKIWKLGWMEY